VPLTMGLNSGKTSKVFCMNYNYGAVVRNVQFFSLTSRESYKI